MLNDGHLLVQVYHDLVPVICEMLGGDRGRIMVALLCGSLLPLCMFLAWTSVTLAGMPSGVGSITDCCVFYSGILCEL